MTIAPLPRPLRSTSTVLVFALAGVLESRVFAQTAPAKEAPEPTASPTPKRLTADEVGARAAATSYQAKAAEHSAESAALRSEAAWANYFPRFNVKAGYTRLSEFAPPSFGGGGSLVGTPLPAGSPNPTPTFALPAFAFPLIFDQWLAQATMVVPISDYFLRIAQGYTAATKQEEAAQLDISAARAKSLTDGKIAFYTWLRARGAVVVAEQGVAVASAHLVDAKNQFSVGNASKADVLRAETQVAAAELMVERAKTGAIVTERQVRVAMHAKEDERLEPGESLDTAVAPASQDPRALITEALGRRPELKSLERNAAALRKVAEINRAGRYPSLAGFGDVTYANPNPRRIPQQNEWFPTWAVGAQLTWSPNEALLAGPSASDTEARAAALEAQQFAVRDGIELEVTQAYQAVRESEVALASTARQLESAEEGYRVARELFTAGRGTATTLIDAETALAQTRFERLQAKVDARLARIRLDHAVGRDVK